MINSLHRISSKHWLVTGAAGFIGSHLVENLLNADQIVTGLDNFSTGHQNNIDDVLAKVSGKARKNFAFVEGDIRDLSKCSNVMKGIDIVLHQAALGSVPRSIEEPISTHDSNVSGFINILEAARNAGVRRIVYASSSSVYGDSPKLPKTESETGKPLSPYAASKRINEIYAEAFTSSYDLVLTGLRYFNVFGPRQDPEGSYAAVIPRWFSCLLRGEKPQIFGDGSTSRDFCYIDNVVRANLLAATAEEGRVKGEIFNVACGERTTLNELFGYIKGALAELQPEIANADPEYREFRTGDILHSCADINKIRNKLSYEPVVLIQEGIRKSVAYYKKIFSHSK